MNLKDQSTLYWKTGSLLATQYCKHVFYLKFKYLKSIFLFGPPTRQDMINNLHQRSNIINEFIFFTPNSCSSDSLPTVQKHRALQSLVLKHMTLTKKYQGNVALSLYKAKHNPFKELSLFLRICPSDWFSV